MKLRSLSIIKLPGLDKRLHISQWSDNMNFVIGPNASGKTSLIRALGFLLNPPSKSDPTGLILEAEFEVDGKHWSATRAGPQCVWKLGQEVGPRPNLPATDILDCHLIRIEDLLSMASGTDESLAEQLQIEMDGGLNLKSLKQDLQKVSGAKPRAEERAYHDAREQLNSIKGRHRSLAKRQSKQPVLDQQIDNAKKAQVKTEAIEIALDAVEQKKLLKSLSIEKEAFPKSLSVLSGDEADQLHTLEATKEKWNTELISNQQSIDLVIARQKETGTAQILPDSNKLKRLKQIERRLSELLNGMQADEVRLQNQEALLKNSFQRLNPEAVVPTEHWPTIDYPGIDRAQQLARKIDLARSQKMGQTPSSRPSSKSWFSGLVVLGSSAIMASAWLGKPQWAAFFSLGIIALMTWDWILSQTQNQDSQRSSDHNLVKELETQAATLAKELGFSPALLSEGAGLIFVDIYRQYQTHKDAYDLLVQSLRRARQEVSKLGQDAIKCLPMSLVPDESLMHDHQRMQIHLQGCVEKIELAEKFNEELKGYQRERPRLEQELQRTHEVIALIYDKAKLQNPSPTALEELLALRPAWKELEMKVTKVQALLDDRLSQLETEAQLLAFVDALDSQSLIDERKKYEEQASQLDQLHNDRAALKYDIAQAFDGDELADATAELTGATESLMDKKEACLLASTALFWLNRVDQETRASSGDRTFDLARSLFSDFTQHQWELTLDGAFGAKRTRNQAPYMLSQLSTATRMQLLLAVRMARVLHSESHHESLPIMLDEALTTSDPERASEIMKNLHDIAEKTDHQIIYLAASNYELQLWEHVTDSKPRVIRLDQQKDLENSDSDPLVLNLHSPPPLPDPKTNSPEAYAEALSVERLAAHQPADDIHLFYLLADQLSWLHELISQWRITRLGPFERWLSQPSSKLRFGNAQVDQWRLRCTITRSWWALWHQGRSRPIDETVIYEAQNEGRGLTEKTVPGVLAMAEKSNFDPLVLLDKLKDEPIEMGDKMRRLSQPQWQLFEEFLTEAGYLSDQPILDETSLRLSALENLPPDTGTEEIRALQSLIDRLESGQQL